MSSDRKSLLITGAGHGIGRATARLMASRGWVVGVNDLKKEFTAEAVAEIRDSGGEAFAVVQNVSTRAGVNAAIDAMLAQTGRLDGLVNNAAWVRDQAIPDIAPETVKRILNVGLSGIIWAIRAAAAAMAARTLALECAPAVIRVTCIVWNGRGTPEDLGAPCRFLTGPEAVEITGQAIQAGLFALPVGQPRNPCSGLTRGVMQYIKDRLEDVIAAIVIGGIGLFILTEASSYRLGALRRMGRGYFPAIFGALIVARDHAFLLLDPASGAVQSLLTLDGADLAMRLNDGASDRSGRFTCIGMRRGGAPLGAAHQLDAQGRHRIFAEGIRIGNGVCFSPDGRTLDVTDTPARKTFACDDDPASGATSPPRLHTDTALPGAGVDGQTVDRAGCPRRSTSPRASGSAVPTWRRFT